MNPPCYRCTSTVPLQAGRVGLCPTCEAEVTARANLATDQICSKCGQPFFNDWERIQHQVNQRHGYLSWTPEDGKRFAELDGRWK